MAITNGIPSCGQNKMVCFRLDVSLLGGHCPVGFGLLPDVIQDACHGITLVSCAVRNHTKTTGFIR